MVDWANARMMKKHARWTTEEDAELKRRCEAGEYLIDIARIMGRTQEGVRTRCNVLGIPCRSAPRQSRAVAAE
jgi:hypothetical protein